MINGKKEAGVFDSRASRCRRMRECIERGKKNRKNSSRPAISGS